MTRLIECVPNFSEGRELAKVDAIVDAMASVPGAWILDRTSDPDHNRSVITLAGEPDAVVEAAIRGAGKAAELIDMTLHQGAHPRIGATDVIPFVPLEGISVQECVALAHRVGQELWDRYRIPVYFYEAAATRPERKNLESIRKGQLEGLREDALCRPDRSPDIGEPRLHPTAGATAVGVRKLLIAYNIHLNTSDVGVAKRIARAIRFSSGGLRNVKAIGVDLKSRGIAQVSINLTDFERTPLHRVFELVKQEAGRLGCAVTGSEIVGLIPRKAIELSAEYYLQLENFSSSRVLENRLAEVTGVLRRPHSFPPNLRELLDPLLDHLELAVRDLSGRAPSAPADSSTAHNIGTESGSRDAIERHLRNADAAARIFHQLEQLEAGAAPSIILDLRAVRELALGAGHAALAGVRAILPTLQDASTRARLSSRLAEIEGQLTNKPLATER